MSIVDQKHTEQDKINFWWCMLNTSLICSGHEREIFTSLGCTHKKIKQQQQQHTTIHSCISFLSNIFVLFIWEISIQFLSVVEKKSNRSRTNEYEENCLNVIARFFFIHLCLPSSLFSYDSSTLLFFPWAS